ncbi:MAG: hypothetical protein R6U50_17155 [Desulfobacterales bacterium]
MKVAVSCDAGGSGEETPRRFRLGDRKVEVAQILDRWPAADHWYYKIRGDDDSIYILRHDLITNEWEMTFYTDVSLSFPDVPDPKIM